MNAKPEQRAQAAALLEKSPWLSDREVARQVGLGNKTVSRLRAELGIARGVAADDTPGVAAGATPGEEDLETAERLSAVELVVAAGASERKLRRWQTEGLLPEPTRYWVGKRRVALYAPRDVERVTAVAELMDRYHDVDRVALGLLALGFTPQEDRLRAAYDRFLARQQESFTPLDAIFNVLRKAKRGASPELDAAVVWLETLVNSPRMEWARRVASVHESEDVPLPDATLEYLENVSKIFVSGSLGSDEAVERLLAAFAARMESLVPGSSRVPNELSMPEQVRTLKAMQRATRVSTLRRLAAEAPLDEITRACDELVTVVVGYLVLIDSAPYIGDGEPAWEPPVLCEVLNIDPSALASLGLLVASFKRDPEAGEELTNAVINLSECFGFLSRFVLARINGRVPALEAVAARYLGNQVGRDLLLTASDDDEAHSPN